MKALFTKFHRSSSSRTLAPAVSASVDVDARDVFARLPFELHVLILACLGPREADAALCASRILRLVWLSEEIWPALADRWFPGLSHCIRLTVHDEAARGESFRRSLRMMCRRTAGKFSAAMHYRFGLAPDDFFQLSKSVPTCEGGVHSYESVEDLEANNVQRFVRFMIYSNGRVAWWPEGYSMPYLAVVDDLRTRMRRVYLFPCRDPSQRGYKTAMGKKLFIIGCETKLHVWHLELNRLESFEVPESFRRCVIEDETVLVITQNSDVYIWKFGETLRYINMHKLQCYPREYIVVGGPPVWTPRVWLSSQQGMHLRNSQMLIDFILSPTLSNVFFVITLALDESGQLTVHEIHNGAIAATYVMEDRIYSDPRTTEKGLLRWERLNSYGGYCLAQVIQQLPSDLATCSCGRDSPQLVSLCFNIYTKKFTALRHHLGGLSPWVSHVWNDKLCIMNMDARLQKQQKGCDNKTPVLSLAPCAGDSVPREREVPVPLYTTLHEDVPLIHRRRRVPFDTGDMGDKLDIELGLDVLQEYSPDPEWNSFIPGVSDITPGKLVGDDEFFIYVNAPSYTVLSFGEDFPPRLAPSEENNSRSWWRKPRAKDKI